MKLLLLPLTMIASLGFDAGAMADHSMHHVYHHHYMRMHSGAHLGHRQPCIGLASGTAHHSCGTHTGGPSGSLH